MQLTQQQLQMQVQSAGPINGFFYSFAKPLLDQLNKLVEEKKVFDDGNWPIVESTNHRVHPFAQSVITHLANQIEYLIDPGNTSLKKLEQLRQTAKDFIGIFDPDIPAPALAQIGTDGGFVIPNLPDEELEKIEVVRTMGDLGGYKAHVASRLRISLPVLEQKLNVYQFQGVRTPADALKIIVLIKKQYIDRVVKECSPNLHDAANKLGMTIPEVQAALGAVTMNL